MAYRHPAFAFGTALDQGGDRGQVAGDTSVVVGVVVLEALLMHVGVAVGHVPVAVLVLVLDMLVVCSV